MPIQFVCPGCQQTLLARDEHALRWVRCPKCREVLVVPSESTARKTVPEGGSSPGIDAEAIAEPVAGDEARGGKAQSPQGEARSAVAAGATVHWLFDRQRVAVPRWLLYAHGLLLAVVALVALAAGMWIGRSGRQETAPPAAPPDQVMTPPAPSAPPASPPTLPPPELPPVARPVPIVGKLTWHGLRREVPDGLSAVIVYPDQSVPKTKIDASALLPTRPVPGEKDPAVLALKKLGGAYARTDREGLFLFYVVPGRYRMLMISHNSRRPAGTSPRAEDLAELSKIFTPPDAAMGPQKYRLTTIDLRDGTQVDWYFGESGRP